jgi:O-methyltransferase/methyltransferase family protein
VTTTAAESISHTRAIAEMLVGNQLQQAIYVAARLGIADLLREGPASVEELAQQAEADSASLRRLLRALAGFGIFAEDDDGRFSLTPLAEPLQSGTPQSVASFALWSGGVSYQAFGGLYESVRSGTPAFESLFGMEFFEYLGRHPESGSVFDEMMARHTAPIARAISAYDWSGVKTVVDVGGGGGDVLAAVLREHPGLRGVLVDHPRTLERARRTFEHAGVGDRATAVAGTILEGVPAGDVYVLKSVLHGLSDENARQVLSNCRKAMHADGRVLAVEFIVPPGNTPSPARLMDLLMLVGCHGRERSEEEFRTVFADAGFRVARVTASKHGYSIVEARPAQPRRAAA